MVAVTVEERAKLAPKFPPKLTLWATPAVFAMAFVTALPSVFATAVPVVSDTLLEIVLVSPFVNVSDAVLPNDSPILLLIPLL